MFQKRKVVKIPQSEERSDELYTPTEAVRVLLPFVHRDWRVWCPFDRDYSAYPRVLKKHCKKVINSHIQIDNGDFFKLVENKALMADIDCIISNPPFSLKSQIFRKCAESGKPFALFLPLPYTIPLDMFDVMACKAYNVHFIWLRKRTAFFCRNKDGNFSHPTKDGSKSNVAFSTNYWCGNGFIHDDCYVSNRGSFDMNLELNGDIFGNDGVLDYV